MKIGLDFGTTNSSIAVYDGNESRVLKIDQDALDQRVVRSMLYFPKREIVYDPRIPKARIENQIFMKGDFSYEGDDNPLIGQKAINKYLEENKDRRPGIIRRIFTGRIVNTYTLEEAPPGPDSIKEYYEDIDYGTGRLMQALKTGLKSPFYKGTTVFGEFYSLEQLISIFINQIIKMAEEQLGQEIKSIRVGRPVYFLDNPELDKRVEERLKKALELIGLEEIQFEFEPVAASKQFLAKNEKVKRVLIFDFGGGTLDTAIVEKKDTSIEVLAVGGVYIGGDLLNSDIFEAKLFPYFGGLNTWGDRQLTMPTHLYNSLKSWYSIPNLNNPQTLETIRNLSYKNSDIKAIDRLLQLIKMNLGFEIYQAIEKAKIALTDNTETIISYQKDLIDIKEVIRRDEFEKIIKGRVEEIEAVVLKTLKDANLDHKDIDLVVRTGGSSLIPVFEMMLKRIFGNEKIQQFETFTSIAAGLALD